MSEQSQVTDGNSLKSSIPETQVSEAQTNASDGSQPAKQAIKSCQTWNAHVSKYDHIPRWKWETNT
jgi:hypothetical protein